MAASGASSASSSDPCFSAHIACTEDWQPQWRHRSADILYFLHLIWSNWLIILVLSLVATPSAGQEHDAGDNTVLINIVKTRYLDRRQCLNMKRDELAREGNCTCTVKPPDIKEFFRGRLPWERGTTSPPVGDTTTTVLTSTLVMIPEPTGRTTQSAVTGPHTPSVEARTSLSPSTTFPSTPPRDIDNPKPTGHANTGDSEVSFDSKNQDVEGEEGEEEESKEISDYDSGNFHHHNDIPPIIGSNIPKGSGGLSSGEEDPGNAETSIREDPVSLTFAIIIPILVISTLVILAVYALYKTQRGKRGRYQIHKAFTRLSRRNQSPSTTTANGSANNQQSDIEINDVKASPHYKNGGTPAKCRHESEVTSDQEEGNVNSHMLKHRESVPCDTAEDRRKSLCKTPDENRRPSRQIRLDSQSPLVSNMDESDISEDEVREDGEDNFGSNGHLAQTEDEMLNDTFDSVDLKNGNLEGNGGLQNGDMHADEEMVKRNSSNSVTG